jgi:hypothetical protein
VTACLSSCSSEAIAHSLSVAGFIRPHPSESNFEGYEGRSAAVMQFSAKPNQYLHMTDRIGFEGTEC